MLPYNARLAWLSIRSNPILTTLMVAAIAVGIGACMTMLTIYYMLAKNPIPEKSELLYHVQLENGPMTSGYEPDSEPRDQLSYTDATRLLADGRGLRRSASFKTGFAVQPASEDVRPYLALARVTSNDFFEMFAIDFLYGGAWDDAVDEQAQQVVVLSKAMNDQLFGGEDSVGKTVRLGADDFLIAGVIEHWHPSPKYFDLTNGSLNDPEEMYIPFSLTPIMELDTSGNTSCYGEDTSSYQDFLASECNWITYWVELASASEADGYRDYLGNYIEAQKQLGRFERPSNYRARSVTEWLEEQEVAGDDVQVMVWLSFLFLTVCVLNTVGLILAKFLARVPQIALRRAVGASRAALFRQHLVEIMAIGLLGGLAGIGLAMLGLWGTRAMMNSDSQVFSMDWTMAGTSVLIALSAAICAGLYPAFRVGHIAPARYLKTQ